MVGTSLCEGCGPGRIAIPGPKAHFMRHVAVQCDCQHAPSFVAERRLQNRSLDR